MIPPEASTPATACDGDARCMRVACFQVQLEASRPQPARRQALACAHHVADVIEALRGWAREQDLAGGHLTVLAIEPAAGEHQAGGSGGPARAALRVFPFSTIPLKTVPASSADHREPAG